MADPTMGPDHPPNARPSDPFYWPQPANNDDLAFLGSQFDERFLDPSPPPQGTSTFPEMVQENCLPDPSNQSSMHHAFLGSVPSGNGAIATSMPHSETFHEPLDLGTRSQQIQCGNTLGTSEYPYVGQPQTVHPLPATRISLNNWQQSASLPRNSLGPHSRSQEWIELALSDSFLGASTSSGLPPEAATTSFRQELVDESAPQVTNISPNAARGIELVSPRPADGETTVQVRRDIRITLNFDMKILSSGSAIYDGLKIPKTPSVNKEEVESGKKLLHLQIRVLGVTTKGLYNTLCHKCKDRDGDKDAFPDFRAKSNIIVPQKNGRLLVAFILACCSKHREPQDSEYCLEVVLNGDLEQNTPCFQYLLPYSFSVVSKRTRNQGEDLDAVDAVAPPPHKLPKIGSGRVSRFEGPESQGAGPSGLGGHSSGDSKGPTNNISSGTSDPPAAVDDHLPTSPAEAPTSSCRRRQAVNAASGEETAEVQDLVIELVSPGRGPTTGGHNILILGSNFPTDATPLYASFGDNFTRAVPRMPNVFLCILPQSSVAGMVPVSLRRSPNLNAPVMGTSLCQFEYTTDLDEILPIIIRIQEYCTPEVSTALDILRKEAKNPNLKTNGKRPLPSGEASHVEVEAAIIQSLAPLQGTLGFGEVISTINDYKQTLAHFAIFFGYTNLLKRLLEWNIDLTIADVNGFTALHCAYKEGDRACVDLLLAKGASETVLDALGRAPSHLMPEGFASLSDHGADTASDDQPELEQKRDAPYHFRSTDSGNGVLDSGEEESMDKAGSTDLMHKIQSSNAASSGESAPRSSLLPVARPILACSVQAGGSQTEGFQDLEVHGEGDSSNQGPISDMGMSQAEPDDAEVVPALCTDSAPPTKDQQGSMATPYGRNVENVAPGERRSLEDDDVDLTINDVQSLKRGIIKTSKNEVQAEYTILLVGETGVGKSTFLEYLANVVVGNNIDNYNFEVLDLSNEQHGSSNQSQTNSTRLYEFRSNNGVVVRILDVPGLADTRGIKDDELHKRSIAAEIRKHTNSVTAVLVLGNGTVPRITAGTDYALSTLSAIFLRPLVDNIALVFTNVPNTPAWNFSEYTIRDVLKDAEKFLFDNPVARQENYLMAKGDTSPEKFRMRMRKEVLETEERALEMLVELFDWLDGLRSHPSTEIVYLYDIPRRAEAMVTGAFARMGQAVMFTNGDVERRCTKCGKTESQLGGRIKRCTGCDRNDLDGLYCNEGCQKADWTRHKLVCKVRKPSPPDVDGRALRTQMGSWFTVYKEMLEWAVHQLSLTHGGDFDSDHPYLAIELDYLPGAPQHDVPRLCSTRCTVRSPAAKGQSHLPDPFRVKGAKIVECTLKRCNLLHRCASNTLDSLQSKPPCTRWHYVVVDMISLGFQNEYQMKESLPLVVTRHNLFAAFMGSDSPLGRQPFPRLVRPLQAGREDVPWIWIKDPGFTAWFKKETRRTVAARAAELEAQASQDLALQILLQYVDTDP